MTDDTWFAILLGLAAVLGIRGSWRLFRRYRAASRGEDQLTPSERLLLGSIVGVAWFLTVVAIYLGVLSIRRLLGYEPLTFTAPITAIVAMLILLIPAALDLVVDWIAKGKLWGKG